MKIKKISQSAGVIANVIDSLESSSSIDALSANKGKELQEQINEINDKSAMTITLPVNTPVEITETYEGARIPLTGLGCQKGLNLILENEKIKVNKSGYYRISAATTVTGANGTTQCLYIWQNDLNICSGYQVAVDGSFVQISLPSRIIYAEEGDEFSLQLSSNVINTYTVAGSKYTYLTVEEI